MCVIRGKVFTKIITEALDETAPVKTFSVRSHYRFGISDETKELMQERDSTRRKISYASTQEKKVLQQKYNILRNKVTSKIRQENIDFNNNRVEEAGNESELWKVANETISPKKDNQWKIEDLYDNGTRTVYTYVDIRWLKRGSLLGLPT